MLPQAMPRKISAGALKFGFADDKRVPPQAYVFFQRVIEFAAEERVPWPGLLGTIIVRTHAEGALRRIMRSDAMKTGVRFSGTFCSNLLREAKIHLITVYRARRSPGVLPVPIDKYIHGRLHLSTVSASTPGVPRALRASAAGQSSRRRWMQPEEPHRAVVGFGCT